MTPKERQLWLARHKAPKNMRLVTDIELAIVGNGLREVQAQLKVSREETELQSALANKYKEEVAKLKGALALGQENCDAVYEDLRRERDHYKDRLAKLVAHLKNPDSGWTGPWEELEEYEEEVQQ